MTALRACWNDDAPGAWFSGASACLSALLFAGRVDEALADADRAVELAPEESIPYLWRGIARLEAGHRIGARADQTRAQDIDVLGSLKQREDFEAETWRLALELERFESVQKFLIGNY